jgi:hypothetical protein
MNFKVLLFLALCITFVAAARLRDFMKFDKESDSSSDSDYSEDYKEVKTKPRLQASQNKFALKAAPVPRQAVVRSFVRRDQKNGK